MLRCHNCEVLDCPQEEYPARLLPTPPPSYIDNLQSRLIRARKGIFPASLEMILKTEYQLPVQRSAIETSMQPDGVIREHRAGENNPTSEGDSSPRRAAIETGSEEPGTPPKSPAISTRSEEPGTPSRSHAIGKGSEEPGASRAPFETSTDSFLHSNLTSTEQESALLHQQDVGVDDDEKETTTTTQRAAVREKFVSPAEKLQRQGTTTWAIEQHKLFDRGRSL